MTHYIEHFITQNRYFAHNKNNPNDIPQVVTYIIRRIYHLWFTFRNDILDHWDINILLFQQGRDLKYILNVYSDNQQQAIYVLQDVIFNLNSVALMTSDFNIRDNNWDPTFPHHSQHTADLTTIIDSLGLDLLMSVIPMLTRYADNTNMSCLYPCMTPSLLSHNFLTLFKIH